MKKLFNSRFLIILASSLVVLILLALGAFYLFDDEDDVFIKSGYVLNPLSTTSEKYFFDENVGYKENLSSMIEFEDVDKKTVSVLKDSFLHYNDESLSFLKRGAILDLDSVSGSKAVSFYNISNNLLFEKKDGGYVIEASSGDVRLDNFIGRISDNKYIIVGDLSLKMAGNDVTVKGKYFEVVYIEEGIVNIENKDVKYQVTAEDTFISVGNKVIDLGDKKITVDGEDLMSITAITIDGDENIELIPKGNADEEDDGQDDVDDNGNGGTGEGTEQTPGEGDGNDTGTEDGNGQIALVNDVVIVLKSYEAKSTSIKVEFDIEGAKEEDSFRLQVVNLASGRSVEVPVHQVIAGSPITIQSLSPSTKYLFTVVNNKDEGKYFQKILETNSFGIKLEKAYATSDSLVYNVLVDENSDVSDARISLLEFDIEEKKYKPVKFDTGAVDEDGNVIMGEHVKSFASLKGNYENIKFGGLKSDTIYTAVIDGIAVGINDYGKTYEISLTSMTLKETPDYTKATIVKDVGTSSFDLSLGTINDPDNAITKYTYYIFKEEDRGNEDADYLIKRESTNASPVNIVFGSNEGELNSGTNYYFKTVVEYFDNEKHIDFITDGSLQFTMERDAYVTIEEVEEATTHNYFKADITIADSTCIIPMPGRDGCPASESPVSITISKVTYGSEESKTVIKTFDNVEFASNGGVMTKTIEVSDLDPGTTYDISVKSVFDVDDTAKPEEIKPSEQSRRIVTTKDLASFEVGWSSKSTDANEKHVVYATAQLLPLEPKSNEISTEESLKEIEKVVMRLYDGAVNEGNLDSATPVSGEIPVYGQIKDKFFDNPYLISSLDTFEVNIELLKRRSGGELSEYYTIYFRAYSKTGKEVKLSKKAFVYAVPEHLRKEIKDPTLSNPMPIYNRDQGYIFKNVKGGTVIGYQLTGAFDRESFKEAGYEPIEMNFYVYDAEKRPLKFYIKDEKGKLSEKPVDKFPVSLDSREDASAIVFMDYGTIYDETTIEEIMTRGNEFYVGFDIKCINLKTKKEEYLPKNSDDEFLTTGIYAFINNSIKETPTITSYISKSTGNTVTYKYKINDPDNAIYIKSDSNKQSAIYANVNDTGEKSFNLGKIDENGMKSFTIEGLNKGDQYQLYYYTILKKYDKDKEGNIIPATRDIRANTETGMITFEGEYDAKNNISKYNFTYRIINNTNTDNKVTIKINANEDILSRILGYKISFKDQKGNSYIVNETDNFQLSECPNDDGAGSRCISVKYDDLKKMKSDKEKNEKNWITVTVEAIYDNGISGFDYKVGPGSTNDYKFCILQTNNSEYISTTKSTTLETWSEKLQVPKGYYICEYNSSSDVLKYTSQLFSHEFALTDGMSENGYTFGGHLVTPKMVTLDKMSCNGTDCDKFYFENIKPKIAVRNAVPIINGSKYTLQLTGVDKDEVDIVKEDDGKRYLYIEVWERKNEAGAKDEFGNIDKSLLARPTVKVELMNDPLEPVNVLIDGLKELSDNTGTYYFKVYANLKEKGKISYQELPSEDYGDDFRPKTYELKSASPGNLFSSVTAAPKEKYIFSDTEYNVRTLKTDATLRSYDDGSRFANNVEFVYLLCETTGDCDLNNNIFKSDPATIDSNFKMDILIDLSEKNLGIDIEYGKEYKINIFAIADYYESAYQTTPGRREILISRQNNKITLDALTKPTFEVTREAKIISNGNTKDYVVDLTIKVVDSFRTLIGNSNIEGQEGKYFVKFQDEEGNLVGSMQMLDAEGNVVKDIPNYQNYPLDAFESPGLVRIKGLKQNTKYTVTVYGDAYLNNANIPLENKIVSVESDTYTVYSSTDYGIAFGDYITYTATDNGITVTFVGGSTFDNVVGLNYTIQRVDANLKDHPEYKIEGSYKVVPKGSSTDEENVINPTFDGGHPKFDIEPDSYKGLLSPEINEINDRGENVNKGKEIALLVIISLDVKDPNTDEISTLTREQISGFEGTAVYKIK